MKKVLRIGFYTALFTLFMFYIWEAQVKRRFAGSMGLVYNSISVDDLMSYYEETHRNCILPIIAILENIRCYNSAEESLPLIHSLIHDMKGNWKNSYNRYRPFTSSSDEYKQLKKLLQVDSDYERWHSGSIEELMTEYRRLEYYDFYGYGHLKDLILTHLLISKDGSMEIAWAPSTKLKSTINMEIFQDSSYSFLKEIFFPSYIDIDTPNLEKIEDYNNYTVYQLCEAFIDSRNTNYDLRHRSYAYTPQAAYICTAQSKLVNAYACPYYTYGQTARLQVNRNFPPNERSKPNINEIEFERVNILDLNQLSYEELRNHKQYIKTTRHPKGGDSVIMRLNKPCSVPYMIIDFDPTRKFIIAVTFQEKLDDKFLLHVS